MKKAVPLIAFQPQQSPLLNKVPKINLKKPPPQLLQQIISLKYSAAFYKLVALSANQISFNRNMFAVLRTNLIQPNKWGDYEGINEDDYEVIINPTQVKQSGLRLQGFEECASFPGLRFKVWLSIQSEFKYWKPIIHKNDVKFQEEHKLLNGFQSRIWDHQSRHQQGIMCNRAEVCNNEITITEQFRGSGDIQDQAKQLKFANVLTNPRFLKTMMKNSQANPVKPKNLDPDSIPDKITPKMKKKLGKQFQDISKKIQQKKKDKT